MMTASLRIRPFPLEHAHSRSSPTVVNTGSFYPTGMRSSVDMLSASLANMFRKSSRCDANRKCNSPSKEAPKVKNIYRQPSSVRQRDVGGGTPPSGQAPKRRGRFASSNWHSDPGQLFHLSFDGVSCNGNSNGEFQRHDDDNNDDDDDDDEFRSRTQSLSANPTSILKKRDAARRRYTDSFRRRPARGNAAKKQTTFKEDVAVFYYDDTEQPSSVASSSDCQRLKETTQQHSQGRSQSEPDLSGHLAPADVPPPPAAAIFGSPDVTVVNDAPSGRRRLRVAMTIASSCVHARTAVKVMSGGRTLIVMAYRRDDVPPGTTQHVRRIILPVAVDPYAVKASVHAGGGLTVDAPVCEARTQRTDGKAARGC